MKLVNNEFEKTRPKGQRNWGATSGMINSSKERKKDGPTSFPVEKKYHEFCTTGSI